MIPKQLKGWKSYSTDASCNYTRPSESMCKCKTRYFKCKRHKTLFKVTNTTVHEEIGKNCLSHRSIEITKKEYEKQTI